MRADQTPSVHVAILPVRVRREGVEQRRLGSICRTLYDTTVEEVAALFDKVKNAAAAGDQQAGRLLLQWR